MLFQDQAQQLLSRWENLKDRDELCTLVMQTAIALSVMPDVPEHIVRALDALLDYDSKNEASRVMEIVRYLRSLSQARLRLPMEG